MKEFTVKFTTSDEFEGVIERLGYKYQCDGDTRFKKEVTMLLSRLIGTKFLSNMSVSYKTLKKVKNV